MHFTWGESGNPTCLPAVRAGLPPCSALAIEPICLLRVVNWGWFLLNIPNLREHASCAFYTRFSSHVAAAFTDGFLAGTASNLLPPPSVAFSASVFVSLNLMFASFFPCFFHGAHGC